MPLLVKAWLLLGFTSFFIGCALVKFYISVDQTTQRLGRLGQMLIQASMVLGMLLVFFGAIIPVLALVFWVISLTVAPLNPAPASLLGKAYENPSHPSEAR